MKINLALDALPDSLFGLLRRPASLSGSVENSTKPGLAGWAIVFAPSTNVINVKPDPYAMHCSDDYLNSSMKIKLTWAVSRPPSRSTQG